MALAPDLAAKIEAAPHAECCSCPRCRTRRVVSATTRPVGAWSLSITLPRCEIKSEMNQRDHWAVRKRRFDSQAAALNRAVALLGLRPDLPPGPVAVTLTRISGRRMDDDNLAGGFKAVRDAVARWLQVDDGDPRVAWLYQQEPGKGTPAVRVLIEGGGNG
jgi:hypothetical protein